MQELFKFCGGNKELAAELMLGLDADGDGEVSHDLSSVTTTQHSSGTPAAQQRYTRSTAAVHQ